MSSCLLLSLLAATLPSHPDDAAARALRDALTFHAPFDGGADATFARGDGRIYTSPSGDGKQTVAGIARDDVSIARGEGKFGDALRFGGKAKPAVCFKAEKNIEYREKDWSGTVSLWLRLDPALDLEPGYCDPIQITDKKWNDACFFVDFTQENPRDFRLGAFADFKVWNPSGREWDDVPESERPMVTVKKPPFSREKWTHVVLTFADFNSGGKEGRATLYLNGESQGTLKDRKQQVTWDPSRAMILLGLNYIGLFDELAVFDRELDPEEVKALHALPTGVASLSDES